jgi:hypothetical protein
VLEGVNVYQQHGGEMSLEQAERNSKKPAVEIALGSR